MVCQVTEQLFDVIRLLVEEQKKPKTYGRGPELYHSEVLFLEMLARCPEETPSRLAERLAVTRGAVTQMSAKLSAKGLIRIEQREHSRKEKRLTLTALGREVVREHQNAHKQSNQRICHYVSTLSQEETGVIFRFLEEMKNSVPFCEFHCDVETANHKEGQANGTATTQCLRFAGVAGER